jgi:hypothetical protein
MQAPFMRKKPERTELDHKIKNLPLYSPGPTEKHVQFAFAVAKVLGLHVAVWRFFDDLLKLWMLGLLGNQRRRRRWVSEGAAEDGTGNGALGKSRNGGMPGEWMDIWMPFAILPLVFGAKRTRKYERSGTAPGMDGIMAFGISAI